MRELSHPIATGMQVYPGDPAVHIEPALLLARDGVDVAALRLGSHTARIWTRRRTASWAVERRGNRSSGTRSRRAGRSPRTAAARSTYRLAEMAAALDGGLPDQLPPIVVLDTGWAARFGSDAAFDHPALSADAAVELVRRGMHVLTVDTLSPDPTGVSGSGLPVHQVVLGADALIVENIAESRTRLAHPHRLLPVADRRRRCAGACRRVRAVTFGAG